MDSSTAQRHNQGCHQSLESMLGCPKPQQSEKRPRPADEQALKCPRCDSINTKFCYYNNYSLSQPRYFCKSCRRYWTKGGTLRNIPVGGGCRKNKRSTPSTSSKNKGQDHPITALPSLTTSPLPYTSHHDLSLAIASLQKQSSDHLGLDTHEFSIWGCSNMSEFLGSSGGLLFDSLNGFNTLYCGMGNSGLVENGRPGFGAEIGCDGATTTSTAVTTVKQEICGGNVREGEGRGNVWGMTWQNGIGVDEFDSGRLGWHGGLLNSPLM